MLRLYTANLPLLLLTLPVLAAAALIPLVGPWEIPAVSTGEPFSQWTALWVRQEWPAVIAGVIFICLGGWLLNLVFNRYEFHTAPSFVPGLVYVAIICLFSLYQFSLNGLIANLFVIAGAERLLAMGRQHRALAELFMAGLFFGCAALFRPALLVLAPAVLVIVAATRVFAWREWVIPVLSFAVPFIYWLSYKYVTDQLSAWYLFSRVITFNRPEAPWESRGWNWAVFLAVVIPFVFALPRFLMAGDRTSNKARNVKSIINWLSLFLGISVWMGHSLDGVTIITQLAIPFTFVTALWFTNYRYSLIAPFVFYGWLGVLTGWILHFYQVV